jgi:hypothetical protein
MWASGRGARGLPTRGMLRAQLAQLEPAFGDTRVFTVAGEELAREQLAVTDDDWLHFLCQAR